MRYRVVHSENGHEVDMRVRSRIDYVRNVVSMMLYSSAKRLGISTDSDCFKRAIDINSDLSASSFEASDIFRLNLNEASIRIDRC